MRDKMPRIDRARQFAPFDAMKGLQEALRLKEYEHERVMRGEVSEDKAAEISSALLSLEKDEPATVSYFRDGHVLEKSGACRVDLAERVIKFGNYAISIDDLLDIKRNRDED